MKKALIILIGISLFSCQPKTDKRDASVDLVQGLYVFVLAEPKTQYEVLGQVKNNVVEQFDENTRGKKKFGDILEGVFSTASSNTDFQKLLNNMVMITRDEHPEADALMFQFNLSQGTAIKFKESDSL